MSFLKKLFSKKEEPIKTYADFWDWFQKNEKQFHEVVKKHDQIEPDFLDHLCDKLGEIKEGYFYLTGMKDEETVELILTADGNVKNIVFVEELMAEAPKIKGWLFTCLKQPSGIENTGVGMANYDFSSDNLSFYENGNNNFPDEIDITIVHQDYKEADEDAITSGIYIFLDIFLGELHFATTIDELNVTGPDDPKNKELVPIAKLKNFLNWRQKEFIEKYEGVRHDTENDNYVGMEGNLENGNPLIAIINSDILKWDRKASHPWMMIVNIEYDGTGFNGLPSPEIGEVLNEIEDDFMAKLKDTDGYLNVGRQVGGNNRSIFFACKDFRKPAKTAFDLKKKYASKMGIDFEIFKDKYWRIFDRFQN